MLIKMKIKGLKIDSDFQPFNSCVKNILILFLLAFPNVYPLFLNFR